MDLHTFLVDILPWIATGVAFLATWANMSNRVPFDHFNGATNSIWKSIRIHLDDDDKMKARVESLEGLLNFMRGREGNLVGDYRKADVKVDMLAEALGKRFVEVPATKSKLEVKEKANFWATSSPFIYKPMGYSDLLDSVSLGKAARVGAILDSVGDQAQAAQTPAIKKPAVKRAKK